MTADDIIRILGMIPHPEGGHYAETWRDSPTDGSRGAGSAIYYLLRAGENSHWHRVDAAEIWHWHAGGPLILSLSADGNAATDLVLGSDLQRGHRPQIIVPAGVWQAARTQEGWTLVGCTVSPAFQFGGFEMAAMGWRPGKG
jgi:predicted cupin superfamily sugar epimerase